VLQPAGAPAQPTSCSAPSAGAPALPTPSPAPSAEGGADGAAAAAAAARVHGLAVAWTPHAVFYLRAAPEHWEAVAAVLEAGACRVRVRSPDAQRSVGGRPTEKITHGAKDQLRALAGACACAAGGRRARPRSALGALWGAARPWQTLCRPAAARVWAHLCPHKLVVRCTVYAKRGRGRHAKRGPGAPRLSLLPQTQP